MAKIKYELEFIPFNEALGLFQTERDLLNALQEGKVIARGDYCPDPTKEPTHARVPIEAWCWINYRHDRDSQSLFGGVDEDGSDDPQEYRNIVIDVSSINHLKNNKNAGRGAPVKYDWDSFWRQIAYDLYAYSQDYDTDFILPDSLRDWARNAPSDCVHAWGNANNAPGETTLEEKLRPLFDAIKTKNDEPILKAAERYRSGSK